MGVNRNDVRVLKPSKGLGLTGAAASNLERHRPIGQLPLLCKEDPCERTAAEFFHQIKAANRLTCLRK
jgi:hypothetical protein